jgi:two-component system, OmpR family, response regulator ChvI
LMNLSLFHLHLYHIGAPVLALVSSICPPLNICRSEWPVSSTLSDITICFITAFEVYYKSLRELFPTMRINCYIKKPITPDELAERIKSELVAAFSSS